MRNGADWTSRFPHLVAGLASLPCESAILDAELVHPDGFGALHQCAHKRGEEGLQLWAFDLVQLDGNDLRAQRLSHRRRQLGHLIARKRIGRLHLSETFTNGEQLFAECDRRGLEGVVAKHMHSIYRSGRSISWIKIKCPAWREANWNRRELFGEGRTGVL